MGHLPSPLQWQKVLRLAVPIAMLAVLLAFRIASARAQEPYAVTFTAEGPATARPGETLSYRLHYSIGGASSADVVMTWFGPVTYVSTTAISGELHRCELGSAGAVSGYVRCTLAPPAGILETTLQLPPDVTGGVVRFRGAEPGSGSPGLRPLAGSNTVITLITPAAPPGAGNGPLASSERVISVLLSAFLLAAGITALAAAAQSVLPPRRTR